MLTSGLWVDVSGRGPEICSVVPSYIKSSLAPTLNDARAIAAALVSVRLSSQYQGLARLSSVNCDDNECMKTECDTCGPTVRVVESHQETATEVLLSTPLPRTPKHPRLTSLLGHHEALNYHPSELQVSISTHAPICRRDLVLPVPSPHSLPQALTESSSTSRTIRSTTRSTPSRFLCISRPDRSRSIG